MQWLGICFFLLCSTNLVAFSTNETSFFSIDESNFEENKILVQKNLSSVSRSTQAGEIVDFGSYYPIESGYYYLFNMEAWRSGFYAFNYAPELTLFFARLQKGFHINTAVETGTFFGGTTAAFSYLFDEIHTIEIQESTFLESKQRLKEFPNVHCYLGSSEQVLSQLLPSLDDKRVLFYLDAHWQSYWPLLQEIEEISKTHRDNCIIVIDDFKVPGRADIPYDAYGVHECSLEYIQSQLNKAFSSYLVYYLIPKNKISRAKAVIIPKKWMQPQIN